jgi:hypothetical protein
MSATRTLTLWIMVFGAPVLITGCGARSEDGDRQTLHAKAELGDFYESYYTYVKKHGKVPQKIGDLKKKQKMDPESFGAARKGDFEVVWGVEPDEDSKAVLAYDKRAPKEGGAVLLANGHVKTMTAEELQAALNKG